MTQIVATENFESTVLNANKPVLVDFYAEWCGPCKALSPVLEQLAGDYADSVDVVKVDIDASPETAAAYRVRGVPTLALFHNGHVVDTIVGAQPKTAIAALINRHVT